MKRNHFPVSNLSETDPPPNRYNASPYSDVLHSPTRREQLSGLFAATRPNSILTFLRTKASGVDTDSPQPNSSPAGSPHHRVWNHVQTPPGRYVSLQPQTNITDINMASKKKGSNLRSEVSRRVKRVKRPKDRPSVECPNRQPSSPQETVVTVASTPVPVDENEVFSKRGLRKLTHEIDQHLELDEKVQDLLLENIDDFLQDVITKSCLLAKHRGSKTLEVDDVQLILKRNWKMSVGDSASEVKSRKVIAEHKKRLALLRKTSKNLEE